MLLSSLRRARFSPIHMISLTDWEELLRTRNNDQPLTYVAIDLFIRAIRDVTPNSAHFGFVIINA